MKKIISAIIILSILASQAVLAAPSLLKDYIFSDGEYLYTFGNIEKNSDIDELGVKINGENYKLEDNKLPMAKLTGKFGIGIKDSGNLLGESYSVAPYTVKDENETVGEAIELVKEASVRNLKYHGPESDTLDVKPVLMESLITGSGIYTSPTVYVADNVKPEVKQDQYIMSFNPHAAPANVKNEWMGGVKKWISFDLYESATVKVYTKGTFASMLDAKYGFSDNTLEDSGCYFTMKHIEYPNAAQEGFDHMYTKHIDASAGAVTVAVPNIGGYGGINRMGYVIAIDYDEEEEVAAEITDVKYAGPAGGITPEVALKYNFGEGSPVYCNYPVLRVATVDESLSGNPYIISDSTTPSSYDATIKAAWGGTLTDWITFKINKCATVRILTDGDSLAYGNAGYKKNTETKTWLEYMNTDWPDAANTKRTVLYEKIYDVPKNGETVTVSIPNAPSTSKKWGHIVIIDFDDEFVNPELEGEITNVTYKGPAVEGVTYNLEVAGNLANGSKAYTNYDYYFGSLDASILGKDYIIMDSPNKSDIDATVKAAWDGGATDWYTFEINKSARIKVITDGNTLKNCGKYSYIKCEDTVDYFKTVNSEGAVNRTYNVMYYKDVEVPYGKTVTVTVPNAPTWTGTCKWGHVVVVDYDSFGK